MNKQKAVVMSNSKTGTTGKYAREIADYLKKPGPLGSTSINSGISGRYTERRRLSLSELLHQRADGIPSASGKKPEGIRIKTPGNAKDQTRVVYHLSDSHPLNVQQYV